MKLALLPLCLALFGFSEFKQSISEIYTNEEEVYFSKEAKRIAPPWIGVKFPEGEDSIAFIGKDGNTLSTSNFKSNRIDNCGAFSESLPDKSCSFTAGRDAAGFKYIELSNSVGQKTSLRLSRLAECWAAIPKKMAKENGETDWYYSGKFKIFDQGGMAKIGEEKLSETFYVKLRNVVWPSGNNKPSLVLYIFSNLEDEKAISYSWADNQAQRVGINLRVVQASCTIEK